jgi:hypothetical protein
VGLCANCYKPNSLPICSQISILEVAVDPSYSIFFLEAWQKRLIWRQQLWRIATGCIFVLQAVRFWGNLFFSLFGMWSFFSCHKMGCGLSSVLGLQAAKLSVSMW